MTFKKGATMKTFITSAIILLLTQNALSNEPSQISCNRKDAKGKLDVYLNPNNSMTGHYEFNHPDGTVSTFENFTCFLAAGNEIVCRQIGLTFELILANNQGEFTL
jgi:hypothetical protein